MCLLSEQPSLSVPDVARDDKHRVHTEPAFGMSTIDLLHRESNLGHRLGFGDDELSDLVLDPEAALVVAVSLVVVDAELARGLLAVGCGELELDGLDIPPVGVLERADPSAEPPRESPEVEPERERVDIRWEREFHRPFQFEPPDLLQIRHHAKSAENIYIFG